MKYYKKDLLPLFLYLLCSTALGIYLYGFFPLNDSLINKITTRYKDEELYFTPRVIDKLVLIVIDALRYDFVMPTQNVTYMPFTMNSILNEKSCLIKLKAHSPTVTLPRIKAITSGRLFSYTDVILNFMNSEFLEDNFISKATSNGLKIVFYGDDTWLRLFPKAFLRSEGTSSFFATDYTEVDHNVTRHIDKEFMKPDWDIMILHYLGLDHIGHIKSSKNPLINQKLQEMDFILKKISALLKKLEASEGMKTMLLVTSDHGMKDSGGHGGVTYSEVTVPLISIENPCVILPGWPKDSTALQLDIAPTLSTLFGVPSPNNSMGTVIPSLLLHMKKDDIFKNFEVNRRKLMKMKNDIDKESDEIETLLKIWFLSDNKSEEIGEKIVRKYFHNYHLFNENITNSMSNFKQTYLIVATVLLWIFFFCLLYIANKTIKPEEYIHWFLIFGTFFHAVSFVSTSFIEEEHQTWYFFWTTFCILSFLKHFCSDISFKFSKLKLSLPWLLVVFIHRLFRKLNQTGNKWASLPDLKSYFDSPEGQGFLLALFFLGIALVIWCALEQGYSYGQLKVFVICLLSVIGYRIATGCFDTTYISFYPLSKGTTEIFIYWTFMGIFIIQSVYQNISIHLVWLLLASLLLRPHNVILLSSQFFISQQINKTFYDTKDLPWNCIAHVWLGNLFFFYQGNGNSLSNIDVAPGFVGVESYSPIYAGIMIVIHTFIGFIYSFILSPKSFLIYSITRIMPLVIYCTFLISQLNHLFIWSVFSPKLLYEANLTLLLCVIMFLSYFFSHK